jgi:phenylalanine-4-hydroxylase
MRQDYTLYTPEDHEIWRLLYDRQVDSFHLACDEYIDGVNNIGFTREAIPRFEEMNENLATITGWNVAVVPGWIPENVFFEMLFNRQFPSSTWLRKRHQLDYLEEPDMFHDVFGHVPLLANQDFVNFLFEISKIGLEHIDNPEALELIARIYWYTVEFGLIQQNDQLKIYGAGILSSPGETIFAVSDMPTHKEFDVAELVNTPFKKDEFQNQYFIIDSFRQLYDSVGQIQQEISKKLTEEGAVA